MWPLNRETCCSNKQLIDSGCLSWTTIAASTSRRLVDDVAMLLLRLGVHGRIKRVRKKGYRDCWHLTIAGSQNQTQFLSVAGVHGARGEAARRVRPARHLQSAGGVR
ncbi:MULTISPECIES: LAGLIDADG family homing endonuclease [Rhodococcus]|uniref:LAGLIDADG family homing endonuclease n=1 Tax=Rhodococcus TaxID=1827 RepID=UPI00359C23ED